MRVLVVFTPLQGTQEPESAPHEKSLILEKVFKALRDEGITKADVANELLILPEEIDALTFGLMLNVLKGGRQGNEPTTAKRKGSVRLVHSMDSSN